LLQLFFDFGLHAQNEERQTHTQLSTHIITASAAPSEHSLTLQPSNTSTELPLLSHSSTGTTSTSGVRLQSAALRFQSNSQYPETEPNLTKNNSEPWPRSLYGYHKVADRHLLTSECLEHEPKSTLNRLSKALPSWKHSSN